MALTNHSWAHLGLGTFQCRETPGLGVQPLDLGSGSGTWARSAPVVPHFTKGAPVLPAMPVNRCYSGGIGRLVRYVHNTGSPLLRCLHTVERGIYPLWIGFSCVKWRHI